MDSVIFWICPYGKGSVMWPYRNSCGGHRGSFCSYIANIADLFRGTGPVLSGHHALRPSDPCYGAGRNDAVSDHLALHLWGHQRIA